MPRQDLIQVRRSTAANWTSTNPILASGEIGYETDTRKLKIGNGSSTWNQLLYNSSTLVASDIPNSSISASMLNVASPGTTGEYLIRNTGVTSGFEWKPIPNSSISSSLLNVASSGTTGDYLTRNTGVTSGFEWTTPTTYGTWASYTPTWTQSATITKTVNWARYVQIGKSITGSIKMTSTGAGTANNKITISLPVTASTNNFIMGLMSYVKEAGTTDTFIRGGEMYAIYESTTTIAFISHSTTSTDSTLRVGQTGMATGADITIASGDIIYVQFSYEAA